ncbi:hypothetical protein, partial [Oceanidesulfovibrio marinus]
PRLSYSYAPLYHMIFLSLFSIILLGSVFHILRNLLQLRDIVATPEFVDIPISHASKIDDYALKNMALLN